MTVCVAIKVHDCIVFAADSASSLVATPQPGVSSVVNIWSHGIKVFNLHKELPIVAMTAGMGHFGPASISNLAKDLRISLSSAKAGDPLDKESYTIEEVAKRACEFFESKYREIVPPPANPHQFEFWIGGYGPDVNRGEIWKLVIQDGKVFEPQQVALAEDDDKVIWGGQPQAINRLLIGFDGNLETLLAEDGLPEGQAQSLVDKLLQRTATPLVHSTMPVQDAINLADFLVDVTKRYFAFLPGADVVGGDTDIATVTKHEGFKWIKRKHYYPAELNPKETDHVE